VDLQGDEREDGILLIHEDEPAGIIATVDDVNREESLKSGS